MDPDDSDMGEDSWYVEDVALNNWKLDINQPGSNNDEDEMIDGLYSFISLYCLF